MRALALIGLALASLAGCYEARTVRRPAATTLSSAGAARGDRIVVIRADGRRQEGVVISRDVLSGRTLVRVPDEDVTVSADVAGRTDDNTRVIVRERRVTVPEERTTVVVPEQRERTTVVVPEQRERTTVVVPEQRERVVIADGERRTSYRPTQPSNDFAVWARGNADAVEEFCEWSGRDRNAAAALLSWQHDNPGQAKELIGWAVNHPNASMEQYLKSHPGVAGEELLSRLAGAGSGLLDWARSFPRAAESLVDRPRALQAASLPRSCEQ